MAIIVRLFCAHCNPNGFYLRDRRATDSDVLCAVLPFTEQRKQKDRRQVTDRRVADLLPEGMANRRCAVQGRRFRDGYAWFEGCIDEAIQANWHIEKDRDGSDPDAPATVLCPKCRRKIR
ncbi:MAG: hypothetical protein HQL87_07045 [Magnetococcales bacterium]|nr:hypothetical protein [Magnetococcales bacterium]